MSDLDLLHISIADQCLYGFSAGQLKLRLPVSTALNGAGEAQGSFCTPRGLHRVEQKIGENMPCGAVFKGRKWTEEIWTAQLHEQCPARDWILTRILWLSGCEPGINQGGEVDSHERYIYLHGTADCEPMGVPRSHGCIRLRNSDILQLYPRVPLHCPVQIAEAACPQWATAKLN
jgi:lipoprotein-anchoring transpeptidase ErfK/SrfK